MANERYTISFDGELHTSQMKQGIKELQGILNSLQIPDDLTKKFKGKITDLQNEIKKYNELTSQQDYSKSDIKEIEKTVSNIIRAYQQLTKEGSALANSSKVLQSLVPDDMAQKIKIANNALSEYNKATRTYTNIITRTNQAITNAEVKLQTQNNVLEEAKARYNNATEALEEYETVLRRQRQILNNQDAAGNEREYSESYKRKATREIKKIESSENYIQLKNEVEQATQAMTTAQAEVDKTENYLTGLNTTLNQTKLTMQDTDEKAFKELIATLSQIEGFSLEGFSQDADGVKQAIAAFANSSEDAKEKILPLLDGLQAFGLITDDVAKSLRNGQQAADEYDKQLAEIRSIKTRIEYFFGLNNAINLVRRAMRDAFQTVKELDKAMTETAVVTDFTVGDMWDQLPEYTKRANELGVSTKAVYESATLYYQQGLKTNEVMAMSNETLKMARIAGLDAAVATDRMTNAIRGFNMEINEANAQRIDDVYSRLAAISASNVNEISTAMTKVASLAHSANMEFETTSAFLAQMIETTRESAETAGTALKTVVARFSEVKKLVDENQLKGQDEEGQIIDVNKVATALRTAGIDLNKYFLGEVGLDDIFMELASKWDSLTIMQQRYIATQAAGSRQQSRFIAMMSDYARTQQLVSEAYNANGAAAKQFEKTQDSLQSKLEKLKNAYNEFVMGITNSSIIKHGVDWLTKILNLINSLTSGFGKLGNEGIGGAANAALKLMTLIMALRGGKALIPKGLSFIFGAEGKEGAAPVKGLLGSLLGKLGINTKDLSVAAKSAGEEIVQAGKEFRGIVVDGAKEEAGIKKKNTILGSIVKALGGKAKAALWAPEGKGFLAGTKMLSGGFGSSTIGSALGGLTGAGVAVASVAAVAAIIASVLAIQDYAVSGKAAIKQATKVMEGHQATLDKTTKMIESQQEAYESVKKAEENYQNASNHIEQAAAEQEKQTALFKLSQENPSVVRGTYGNYTLDEAEYQKQLKKLQQDEKLQRFTTSLAATKVSAAEITALENQKLDANGATKSWWGTIKHQFKGTNINEYNAELDEQINKLRNEQQQTRLSAIQGYLSDSKLTDDQKNILSASFTLNGIDTSKRQKELDEKYLNIAQRNSYETFVNVYGEKLDKYGINQNRSTIDLAHDLAEYEANQEQLEAFDKIQTELAKSDVNSSFALIIDLLAEKENEALVDVDIQDLLKKLTEPQRKLLGTIYDISEANLTALAEDNTKKIRTKQAKTAKLLINNGKDAKQALELAAKIPLDLQNSLEELSQKWSNFNTGFNTALISKVADQMALGQDAWNTSEYKALAEGISDNPIETVRNLQKAVATASEDVANFAQSLLDLNDVQLSNASQVQWLLTSDSFDEATEKLDEFKEENGKITASNIREVAESCGELNDLLKNGAISAAGLAKILDKNISFDNITDSLIAAANTLDDLDDTMSSIIDDFNNFDAGYNEHDIANFYNSAYESINDAVERNAYGNNQIRSYYNEIFSGGLGSDFKGSTNDEYAQYIKEQTNTALQFIEANKNNFNDAAEKVFGEWSQNKDLLPEYANMFRIENGQVFYDTLGKTSDELLEIIEKYGQYNGQKISRKTAEALFGYLKEQSPEFSRILSQVDIQKGLSEWYNELKTDINGGKYFTQSDIDAFALLYGISAEEAETQIKETYGILATKVKADNAYDLLKEIGYEDTLKASTYIVKENDKEESFDALDFNKLYNVLAPLGKLDELDNVAKKIIEETGIKKAVANIDGELREFDINTGQSLTEAYEAAIEKTPIEVNGLGEISAAIQDILSVLDPSGKHRDNTETYTQEQNRSKVNLVQDQNSETEFANAQKRRAYEILGNVSRTLDLTNEKIKEIREDIDNNNIVAAYEKIKTSIVDKTESAEEALLEELILFNPKVDTSTLETAIQNATAITTSIVAAATEEAAQSMWRKQARAQAIQQVKKENGWDKLADKEFNKYLDADLEEHIQKLSEQNYRDISSVVEAAGGFNYLKDAFTPKTPTKIPTTGSTTPAIDNTEDKDKGGSDKETEWKNEFDWLYNLMEDLAELQRQQNLLQQQEQDLIRSDNATGHDLYKNLISQYANLSSQLEHQQTILDKRGIEMEELVRDNIEYSKYAWWEDNTVNIDWDKIEAIEDQETYDAVKAFVDEMETVQSKMDEAESSLLDIEAEMYELERKYRDAYIEFENRVKEALIQQYQDTIDQLSSLNETITESNNNILNSIKEQLDLERQIRDNTQTEKDIADKQARLAYLQRDTTGGNQAEILKLQQEIEDAQQNYTDALIDQSIQKLQSDNEKAAEQRQQQITLMQEQLDWNKEQGTFNQEVHDIIERSTNSKGELINGSELEELLKAKDNWTAMTEAERAVWSEKLDDEHDYWNAYYEFLNGDSDGTFWKAVESLKEAINGINMGRTNLGKKHGNSSNSSNDDDSIFEANDRSKWRWTSDGLRPEGRFGLRQNEDNPEQYDVVLDNFKDTDILVNKKGGLNTTTGLAWLDGTPSEPEYVLNARQTAAFLKLADVLPSFMESGINPTSITGGNVYVELNMNVDQISSDYDVDRIVNRVKADIETAASYRNISSISLLR